MQLPTYSTHPIASTGPRPSSYAGLLLFGLTASIAGTACNEPAGGVDTLDVSSSSEASLPGAGTATSPDGSGEQGPGPCDGAVQGAACDNGAGFCMAGACNSHRCGDGVQSGQEQCDDGNANAGDGCSADCMVEAECGNGKVEAGEACDLGPSNGAANASCSATCQLQSVCGNGRVEAPEQCDDGNRVGRDGCSALCTHEHCGNGIVDALEQCDDGNLSDGDGCSGMCTHERCGDNLIQFTAGETCDDGNVEDGDGCSSDCKIETICGNGVLDAPNETCDDGNQVDGDGCSSDCKLEAGYCGDGIAQGFETCDDGNLLAGDGCSEFCQYENEEQADCNPVDSQKLPARGSVIAKTPPPAQFVYTSELFGRYRALCGGCHVDSAQGGFQTEAGTMLKVASEFEGQKELILGTMETDSPHEIMPPGGKPLSELPESAPAVVLASQLRAWYDQGLNPAGFYWEGSALPAHEGYKVDEELSSQLTNIGSCEPTKELLHRNQNRSQRLDAFFAKTDHWPELLSDTDLVSMDSKELARGGVISYATTYQLWADNAKKMRYFKLPYGKKIRFNKEKQLFELPENTRVYKTFLKKVIDLDGKVSYRKMETRVILVRKDQTREDGTVEVKALYGSYKWNADETQATLINTPLRNGEPFADDIFVYDTDEQAAQKARTSSSKTDPSAQLLAGGKVRHYGIPGSARCVECHLGSLEENFVVGFSPMQLYRRPLGEGGVIDKVYPSEMGQLQRFVDWGLFENFSDVHSIKKLEDPQSASYWSGQYAVSPTMAEQNKIANAENPDAPPKPEQPRLSGPRRARSHAELEMQGYMFGNCAHCHNPRGYPSVREPAIAQKLNLHPLTEGGGIFEFRLDNMSPRNERGGSARIPVPYITTSIFDAYQPAYAFSGKQSSRGFSGMGPGNTSPAPWRSLIYRNVDTPYTYVFNQTIYPHMPVHTPGYDCRIRNLTAKWMLGIPSRIKDPLFPEENPPRTEDEMKKLYASLFPDKEMPGKEELRALVAAINTNPQPLEEVYPGEKGYSDALYFAQTRVNKFLSGKRSSEVCLGQDAPAIDETVMPESERRTQTPSLEDRNIISADVFAGLRTEPWQQGDMVFEPHMAAYDLTEVPPPWWPRRADWASALVEGKVVDGSYDEELLVSSVLGDMRLTDEFRSMAMQEIPLGFWRENKQCSFEGDPTIETLPENQRWLWMDKVSKDDQSKPLYYEPAGAILFKSVCAQCHGRSGDSKGAMANTLSELTGGESRVANFDTGIFGPPENRGANLKFRFQQAAADQGLSVDDLGARYMAWMSLGGTRSRIHSAVLSIINSTGLLGQARPASKEAKDGNMLNIAKDICGSMIGEGLEDPIEYQFLKGLVPVLKPAGTKLATLPLIENLADAQLWYQICTYRNPMPVRMLAPTADAAKVPRWTKNGGPDAENGNLGPVTPYSLKSTRAGLVARAELPEGTPVLTHDGLGQNIRVEPFSKEKTLFPMCLRRPRERHFAEVDKEMSKLKFNGVAMPYCPEKWSKWKLDTHLWDFEDHVDFVKGMATKREVRGWVMRGAANAGFMLYAFTKDLIEGKAKLQVDYDRCEERPKQKQDKRFFTPVAR